MASIARLTEYQKAVILERLREGWTVREVAMLVDVSVAEVRTVLREESKPRARSRGGK